MTNSTTVSRVDVTDDPRFAVQFVDTDGNGIVDRMQWTVPQLSEQEFDIEADLEIINVQSYPAVGGNWKVRFTTNGTADLIITAVNGTTFGTASPDDLKFLELNNGTHTLTPIVNGNTITYYNYSSTEEGFEESQVLTPFKHHLMFQFGNKTAFAHNNAFVPNGPQAILLYGDPVVLGSPDTEDDMALTNPVIPGWDEAADRKDPIYTHDETGGGCNGVDDSCTEIEVSEAGTYRVNYGLSYAKSTISAARYQAVSFVQNDTTGSNGYNNGDGMSCFDSTYIRSTDNHRTGVLSGECLVELDAGGKVRIGTSKISSTTGSGSYTFANDESWFAMQKVENPTISLRTNGASITVNNTPDDLTFVDADVVTHDTGTFTFDGSSANAEVTVNDDGIYKVTYSALLENPNNRASIIGKVQTNTSGSFVDDIYGGSISYNRNTDGITDSALSSSTILELNSGDEIKVVLVDETTRTTTATAYHLDIEYLGTSTDANVLRVYNSTGNLNLDDASDVLIDWDKANEIGSHFTFNGDVPPVHGPFNFTADNDADEAAWTFVSDNGNDGLLPSGSTRSWSHETDATPSGTTTVGPNFGQGGDDVTPEGYVYTEATSPATFGDTFHMTLNEVLDADQYDWNVDFYWNQKGDNNLATVELQVNEGGAGWVTIQTFAESGPDRNDSESSIWRHENVDLTTISDPSTQVRFFVEFPSSGSESWNNDFGLDSITITGSKAQAQAPTEEITVNINGLYHIAYGIDSEQNTGVNERFGQKTRLQIDSGSGFADARACFGDSFNRGLANSVNHITATAATSCMINLDAGDTLRVVSLREGDALGGTDVETTGNELYLTIHSLTISNPPLQESLGFSDQIEYVIGRTLTESLDFVDVVEGTKSATISLNESIDFADPPVFIDKSGQVQLTLVESFDFDDGTVQTQVQPFKQSVSLPLIDELDYTLTATATFTESLSLDDETISIDVFVPGTPDFKVQQGTFIMSAASTTGTITEGTDFDQCTGDCFIMQVSTRQTGMGDTSGGGNQFPNNVATRISNVDGLTTPSGTVTFTREGSTNDNRIAWQILEYVGAANGVNEMDVLDTGVCAFGGTDTSCTGSSISGGAADDDDVAVIVTGVSNPDTGAFDWESHLVTTEWKGASNVPVFNRTATSSVAVDVSYAVVEFTGPSWNLQRIEHTGIDAPFPTQTQTIDDVGDLSRAFILQAQQRNDDGGVADNICETGERVWLSETNELSFSHEFGTDACTFNSNMEEVVWILSNTNDATGKKMIVEHQQPTDQLNTSGSEEENWQRTISTLTYGTDETGIFGLTANSDGTDTSHPRGTIVAELTDSSTVDFWQSDSGEEQGYSFSVVQWPRSRIISLSVVESLPLSDIVDSNKDSTISLTESINISDLIDSTNNVSVSLTESLDFVDVIETTQDVSVSLTESLDFVDVIDTTQDVSISLTESLDFVDTVEATKSVSVTLTESLDFVDTVEATKSVSVTLTESLDFVDVIETTQDVSISLTESLDFVDVIDTTQDVSVSLTESLDFVDVIDTTQDVSVSLTESLDFVDAVEVIKSVSVTLTESLDFVDVIDTTQNVSVSLTESLDFVDVIDTTQDVSVTLTESLDFVDAVEATKSASVTLTESLDFVDAVEATKSASISLTESLDFVDAVEATKSASVTLTESLDFVDVIETTQDVSVTLTESLDFVDAVEATKSASVTLTESLDFVDAVEATKSASISLTESLDFVAAVMATKSASISLTESLDFVDAVDAIEATFVTLTESLDFVDTVEITQDASVSLTESLDFVDAVEATKSASISLTESLDFVDVVDTTQDATISLTESLDFVDAVMATKVASISLTESLDFVDVVDTTQDATISLTESLDFVDVVEVTGVLSVSLTESLDFVDAVEAVNSASISLTESLNFVDTVESVQVAVVSLTETLALDDGTVEKLGGIGIQTRDSSSTLLPGATFRITPSPTNGTDTFTITDGDANDQSVVAGIIQIDLAEFNDYQIEMITSPAGYVVTANATSLSLSTSANPSVLFTAVSTATPLADVDPIVTTTSPILNSTSLETLEDVSAIIVNQTETAVSSAEDLPEIIAVGMNNTSGIANATSSQVTLKVTTNTTPGIRGGEFLDQLDMPTHTLPSDSDLTAVIAPIVSEEPSRQVVCSPAFEEVIPGQNMIFSVNSTVIPSIGGVSLFNITSNANAVSNGTFASDYACIEIDNQIINSPSLSSSGIDNELELFFDVNYRYEEDGNGFNWNNSSNFATPGMITALVPKPTSSDIITLSNGCADVEVHTLVGNNWVSTVDTIISNTPSSENTDYCEVVIESDHYSKKAISSKRTSSPGGSPGSGGDSGSGGSGGGSSGGSGGGGGGFAGILETPLSINEVSYDKCRENMVRILISSDAELPPTVTLYTAKLGTVQATLAEVQPFAESNQITNIDRYVYEAPISEDELFFTIRVTEIGNDGEQNTVQTIIHADECSETIVVVDTPIDDEQVRVDRPRIFDTKFQIGTGPQQKSSIQSALYLDKQDLTVSAIIDSKSLLQRVELRTVPLGELDQNYIAMRMNVTSLDVSETSYIVTATLPSYFMVEPGLKYWIHVLDEDGFTIDSRPYEIGVKPTKLSNISVEMDVPSVKAAGSPIKPEVYVFTNNAAAYGKVSLIADGKVVSERAQFFDLGQTKVTFDWDVPESDSYSRNELQGKVELYDSSISTASAVIHSHPKTLSMPASELASLGIIEIDGQLIAEPALLYSSNSDDNMQFRITDPQGQCVIGGTEDCTISESTKDNRGGLTSIMFGDQVLRVKYSGADNALERFSITSIDPITQPWTVSLETTDESMLQEAHAASEPIVKVKYRYHSETITVFSN